MRSKQDRWVSISLCLLVFPAAISNAFVPLATQQISSWSANTVSATGSITLTTTTSLCIGKLLGVGGGGNDNTAVAVPRDVKDAVTKCRAAVQEALQNRCSRMNVEMPVGAKFGVEKVPKGEKAADGSSVAPTKDLLDQSDRELARLFVEMFQPVGSENIAVIFKDAALADLAKQKWKGDYGADCRVLAVARKKGQASNKKKTRKAMGFAAKLAAEVQDGDDDDSASSGGPFVLPGNIEVALFVAPGPKELIQVEKICNNVGMGTLVIILNGRLSTINNFGSENAQKLFQEEFEPVFTLTAAPQQEAPGCLLYRSYPSPWVLARKPKVGPPKPILTQPNRPTPDECRAAYDSLQLGDVERGIENALENVAGWFS